MHFFAFLYIHPSLSFFSTQNKEKPGGSQASSPEMPAAAPAASVPGLCRLASCGAGHAATAQGLPKRHLPEAPLPARPDPALTGKELLPPLSCGSALQETIRFVCDRSETLVRDSDVQRSR